MKEDYGWIYDKKGNAVKVYAPVTSDMKEVKKPTTTYIGTSDGHKYVKKDIK